MSGSETRSPYGRVRIAVYAAPHGITVRNDGEKPFIWGGFILHPHESVHIQGAVPPTWCHGHGIEVQKELVLVSQVHDRRREIEGGGQ